MPHPEIYMDRQIDDRRVKVLKTYDRNHAHNVLAEMDETARKYLWNSLRLNQEYETSETPSMDSNEAGDILWDALFEESREDGNLRSFFVVTEERSNRTHDLYVSPDWPSSEQFAKSAIGESAA